MGLFNWGSSSAPEAATVVPTLNLKVGDTFNAEIGVANNGGVSYRNLSFDITYPLSVKPFEQNGNLSFQVGSIFGTTPKDAIVNKVGDKVACSFTITDPVSINTTGTILNINFQALSVGQGAIALTNLMVLDVSANDDMVQHTTESNEAPFAVTLADDTTPPTGTVIFYVNITA